MEEYFGSCTNHGECEEACPKEISIDFIALMNRDYLKAKFKNRRKLAERVWLNGRPTPALERARRRER